ncbi:MAG: outer membrane beta-barrel protein [Flavobacteriaceae bacterium]|nr:outer membrane beta-barrel protein [Flavobacteriaceae bacterium]
MKHLLTALLLIVASYSFAQIKVEGIVKDSIGNPLDLANVIAINQETKALDSYGITNDKGRYKLNLKKNTAYKLQVSYIGMKSFEEIITTKESDITKSFNLIEDNTLDTVELTYEMPVTIKGDTIIYNADSFKNGTERKLEDILKKLPGVEINDDGLIEVEGKVVSKVMVEGKDFFDGDSKLATKNIPANAVDKIEVLKNHAEIGQLSGVQNNQDNIVINIKLKEGKKNFWFGTVTAGGGISDDNELYIAQPKLFYYSPEYSVNFIGDINNIGEVAFTRRDYFNFTGGFRSPSRQSGTNISLGNNDLGFLTLQNNKAKDINTKFGAANFSFSPNKALDISGFGIFSSSRNELQENNTIQYTDDNNPATPEIPNETTQNSTSQKSDLAMLKLSAKYKPNTNNQLDYDILGRTSKETQYQNTLSSILGRINQAEETNPYSINQNLNYYYTLNDKNIFSLEAQHLLQDEDPFYNAILENTLETTDPYDNTATNLGLNQLSNNYNINQDKRVKSNQVDAKLDYWNIINDKSNINITVGNLYSSQKFDTNLFQFLDNGSAVTPTTDGGLTDNQTKYTFNDSYVGLHYRFITGKFTFTPGVSGHAYSAKNTQFGSTYTDNFFRVLPDFNTRIQLKKSENININYSMKTNFTDVSQLARGIVMNNYNSFFSGSPTLESSLSHNVNLSYFSFNMFNYTNVFANINYNKNINGIRTISDTESVIRTSTPFNSNFSDESVSASGRFQRTFGKLRATASGNFSYSKNTNFIGLTPTEYESYTQTYRAQFRTNFKTAPNVEVSYRYTIQDNDQGATRSKFYTKAPSINFDALIWKVLTFKTDYTYNNFSDEFRTLNSYQFWDASLAYRKDEDSKWEFELKASNLLDTRSQTNSNTSSISTSVTDYYIQPRFLTARIIYSL